MTPTSGGNSSSGLRVIGAGWGRTGTESLKAALELLGFGRCYHAFEMIARARHVRHWKALARGEQPDYDDLFRGFQSAVDFPVARYYRELAARFPEAKVVLSVRDPAEWYGSASKTIGMVRCTSSFQAPSWASPCPRGRSRATTTARRSRTASAQATSCASSGPAPIRRGCLACGAACASRQAAPAGSKATPLLVP
jgi:hypothetical protein